MSREEGDLFCCRQCGLTQPAVYKTPQRPQTSWASTKVQSPRTRAVSTSMYQDELGVFTSRNHINNNNNIHINTHINNNNNHEARRLNGLSDFFGRVGGFTQTFLAGMQRDSTLDAASREQFLKATEEDRKRAVLESRMVRMEDFHQRMIQEIGWLKMREERALMRRRRKEQLTREREEQTKNQKSTRIQAFFRGATARKLFKEQMADYTAPRFFFKNGTPKDLARRSVSFRNLFESRASRIQAIFRAFVKRKSFRKKKCAIEVIQGFIRCCMRRIEKKRFRNALQKLQAACRGYLVREALGDDDNELDAGDEEDEDDDEDNGDNDVEGIRGGSRARSGGKRAGSKTVSQGKLAHRSRPWRKNNRKESAAGDTDREPTSTKQSGRNMRRRNPRISNPNLAEAREFKKARKKAALSLQRTYRGFRARKSIEGDLRVNVEDKQGSATQVATQQSSNSQERARGVSSPKSPLSGRVEASSTSSASRARRSSSFLLASPTSPKVQAKYSSGSGRKKAEDEGEKKKEEENGLQDEDDEVYEQDFEDLEEEFLA